jgi:Na+(H+)/acetate symporter ActP
MPYINPEQKREWELQHRSQRLARRRELRQIEAVWKEAHPGAVWVKDSGPGFLLPVIAGGALAAYNPKLAIAAGGLTLVIAAAYKKDWSWWIVGILILALGLFFQWNNKNENK